MSPKHIQEYPDSLVGGREAAAPDSLAPDSLASTNANAGSPRASALHPNPVNALQATAQFLNEYWLRAIGISALLLIPCLWQRHIEAGDLGSHVYNAWLAQLIMHGQAPGLWIAHQWNNVLFDLLLLHLGNTFGLLAAERISVAIAVLVFFWGAFALICAIVRQIPWRILPCLAIFSYGWTFQMGFFNYYISLGLAFFALVLLYRGRGWQRVLALLPVPLIWMAHPLGLALLLGVGSYLLLAQALPRRKQYYLTGAAVLALIGLRIYLTTHFDVEFSPSKYMFNGADQLFTYGSRYHVLANVLLAFLAVCLLLDVFLRRRAEKQDPERVRDGLVSYSLPLQLYGLILVAAFLLPGGVYVPSMAAVPVTFLTERLTSVSAVLLCCLVGVTKPQKWHLAGFAFLAAFFFVFTYQDTALINKMENQARLYDRAVPPGQRIVATIWPTAGSRIYINHIADRACVGQCFSYGDYEPSSLQFRVRAQPGNPFVTADPDVSRDIQSGNYLVQPRDLPMYQIYQCDLTRTELCMRELAAGETNGRVGLHMPR